MPTLKVKPEFVAKLKALDCYDAWRTNLIAQWNHSTNHSGTAVKLVDLQRNALYGEDFRTFVSNSFWFSKTPEGEPFWYKIISC